MIVAKGNIVARKCGNKWNRIGGKGARPGASRPALALLLLPRYDDDTVRVCTMMTLRVLLVSCVVGSAAMAASNSSTVTFNKDVLPILQKNCQSCHRPGEIAPMSLLTYADARPWAKAIKVAVATKKMPPWFAEPGSVRFSNDRTLSATDVSTLSAWADSGAIEGDAKDRPSPVTFQDGWNI